MKNSEIRKSAIFTSFLVLTLPIPALEAATLPSYSISSYCAKVSQSVGGSYVIEKGCREQENAATTKIRARAIPQRVWSYCDKVANSIGGSYIIFDGCVDQEIGAANSM